MAVEKPTRCGKVYKLGVTPPPRAQYALTYLGYVQFFVKHSAAERTLNNWLTWTEQRDAKIAYLPQARVKAQEKMRRFWTAAIRQAANAYGG